jgi:hypothetical protein
MSRFIKLSDDEILNLDKITRIKITTKEGDILVEGDAICKRYHWDTPEAAKLREIVAGTGDKY